MSRDLPPNSGEGVRASSTDQAYVSMLTFMAGDTGEVLYRFNDSGVDITFNGESYLFFPFELALPSNELGRVPEFPLTITNVDRSIITDLRQRSDAMEVLLEVVASDDIPLNQLSAKFVGFKLRTVEYDDDTIVGRLTVEDFMSELIPKDLMTQALYPGLFGRGIPLDEGGYVPPPEGSLSSTFYEFSVNNFPGSDWQGVELGYDSRGDKAFYVVVKDDEPSAANGQYFNVQHFGLPGVDKPFSHLGIAWRTAGVSRDVEYLVHFINFELPLFGQTIGPIIRYNTWLTSNATGYRAYINSSGHVVLSLYSTPADVNGTQLGSTYALGAANGDDVWIRFRAINSLIQVRTWTGAFASEPDTVWHISATNGELIEGRVGFMSTDGDTRMKVDEVGAAFDGDTAVIPPL